MVVSTIITVNVREYLTQKCIENNINIINVLGPIINVASTILNQQPDYNPGAVWKTDEMYFYSFFSYSFHFTGFPNEYAYFPVISVKLSKKFELFGNRIFPICFGTIQQLHADILNCLHFQ